MAPQLGRITQLESSSGERGLSVIEIQSGVGSVDIRHILLSAPSRTPGNRCFAPNGPQHGVGLAGVFFRIYVRSSVHYAYLRNNRGTSTVNAAKWETRICIVSPFI